MSDKPRELTEILYEMDCAERAVRHARLGLTREDPLEAMKRLGSLAKELDGFGRVQSEFKGTRDCRAKREKEVT